MERNLPFLKHNLGMLISVVVCLLEPRQCVFKGTYQYQLKGVLLCTTCPYLRMRQQLFHSSLPRQVVPARYCTVPSLVLEDTPNFGGPLWGDKAMSIGSSQWTSEYSWMDTSDTWNIRQTFITALKVSQRIGVVNRNLLKGTFQF